VWRGLHAEKVNWNPKIYELNWNGRKRHVFCSVSSQFKSLFANIVNCDLRENLILKSFPINININLNINITTNSNRLSETITSFQDHAILSEIRIVFQRIFPNVHFQFLRSFGFHCSYHFILVYL
jgi:hypothetical protein